VAVDRDVAATWRHQRKISISLINSLPGKNCLVRDRMAQAGIYRNEGAPEQNPLNDIKRRDREQCLRKKRLRRTHSVTKRICN
jgi:hypothetical protein